MSMFYCNWCDSLVDSDFAPNFDYNESTKEWKCEACIENDKDDPEWVGFSNFINLN